MKRKITPAEYKEKLEEQLTLAMAIEGPQPKGFKVVGESNARLDQLRQLNLYKSHLKKEIDENEDEGGGDGSFAMPVGLSSEGGEAQEALAPAEPKRKAKRRKTKRKQPEGEHAEAEEDDQAKGGEAIDEEMDPAQIAGDDDKKKRKKKKKKNKKKKEKTDPETAPVDPDWEGQGSGENQLAGAQHAPRNIGVG